MQPGELMLGCSEALSVKCTIAMDAVQLRFRMRCHSARSAKRFGAPWTTSSCCGCYRREARTSMLGDMICMPHDVGTTMSPLDKLGWGDSPQEHAPLGLVHRQGMKLLDIDNIRGLLVSKFDMCRRRPQSRSDQQPMLHVPETNDEMDCSNEAATDPPGVGRLLSLDIEELVRHTSRMRREGHSATNVIESHMSTDCVKQSLSKAIIADSSRKHHGHSWQNASQSISRRRKRRRPPTSTSPPPPRVRSSLLRHSPLVGVISHAKEESCRTQPLRMCMPASEVQRLDTALKSARYDARQLRTHLQRALVNDGEFLLEETARGATASIITHRGYRGDLDTEAAIRRSRLTPRKTPGPEPDTNGNGDVNGTGMDAERMPFSEGESDATHEQNEGDACDWNLVNRSRLIKILVAEERINAMANHLGSSDSTTYLRSLLLGPRPNAGASPSGSWEASREARWQSEALAHPQDEAWRTSAIRPRLGGTCKFLKLSGDSDQNRQRGRPTLPGKQHHTHGALNTPLTQDQALPLNALDSEELTAFRETPRGGGGVAGGGAGGAEDPSAGRRHTQSREKRKRLPEDPGESIDWRGGKMERALEHSEPWGMRKLGSFSMGQRHEVVAPVATKMEGLSFCSLPRLSASKLSGCATSDGFNSSGGRETPTALRTGFASGGGDKSKRVIQELRRQLEITENGLIGLKARVRADVAWVQETVGARMSHRARVSCCKWGSEKISELTRRWERHAMGRAMAIWVCHRDFMTNRDLVQVFLKRRGAAQIRRLLDVWGRRLTSRSLEEWRRRVRLERRAEEIAAATTIQRITWGFLGRRQFRHALETQVVVRIQAAARGQAGRRRARNIREGIQRNAAAMKIQQMARKREERHRTQRILALKRRRQAAIEIQKSARGLIGRRKALAVQEERLRCRGTVAIQAAWRGVLGRQKSNERRKRVEATQTAQNKAAVRIQAVQRRKAAMDAVKAKRKLRSLQRRESTEIAAVSIQRLVRGRAARAATAAEISRIQKRQQVAAAIHIQRITRGRMARKVHASASISRPIPSSPRSHVGMTPGVSKLDGETAKSLDENGARNSSDLPTQKGNEAKDMVLPDGREEERDRAPPSQDPLIDTNCDPATESGEIHCTQRDGGEPPAGSDSSKAATSMQFKAARKIQAVQRGHVARIEARKRKQKRVDEEAHRAKVWERHDEKSSTLDSNQDLETSSAPAPPREPRGSSSLFSTKNPESIDRDGSVAATAVKDHPKAAILIQSAFRGGRARRETSRRRREFEERKAKATARAQKKRERDAAVKIQSQARARAARAHREEHRQRHNARVGSIRSSGRAAAEDLRALSRPGTAVTTAAGDGGQEDPASAQDPADNAQSPVSSRRPTIPSETPAAAQSTESGSFSIPPAIHVAAVRTPSSVESPTSSAASTRGVTVANATATAAAKATMASSPTPSRNNSAIRRSRTGSSPVVGPGRESARRGKLFSGTGALDGCQSSPPSSPSGDCNGSRSWSPPRPAAKTDGRKSSPIQRSRSVVGGGDGRSRSPSMASRQSIVDESIVGDSRPTGSATRERRNNTSDVDGGRSIGVEITAEEVERMHKEIRMGLEAELHRELRQKIEKELAGKLAQQEEERDRVLREAEEERRRDREAVEEAVRAVREAHDKDVEEMALIKARLKEEEAARRAEQDAGRQEYERCLAEIRAEAGEQAEKRRLAAEAVEALRREMEEDREQRRRQEEEGDPAQAQEPERDDKREDHEGNEAEKDTRRTSKVESSEESIIRQQQQEQQGKEEKNREMQMMEKRELEERQKLEDQRKAQEKWEEQQRLVMQQLAEENMERQRKSLAQLQAQLREEEAKRLESHAAWKTRQAEEEEIAKEERRLELEAIEKLKRELEEAKIRADKAQKAWNAEMRMQMESLKEMQAKAEEQERIRLEAEQVAKAEAKAREDAAARVGAKLIREDDLDFEDVSDDGKSNTDDAREAKNRSTDPCSGSDNDNRQSSTGQPPGDTSVTGGMTHGGHAGRRAMGSVDMKEAVKREIECATGSRLAQVEGALLELSRKQAELESRGKDASTPAMEDATSPRTTSAVATIGPGADAGGAEEALVPTGVGGDAAEWVEYWDESAGASYFFNTVTQEASWTNPNEAPDPASAGGERAPVIGGGGGEGGGGPETLSQPEDGRAKWTECLDEASGSTYYFNIITGEATWEKPAELSKKTETVEGVPNFERPEEWVCYLDEGSGEEYWFSLTTGDTHWGPT